MVLLADDNEVNQEIAIALLACPGIRVDVAANGVEAVAFDDDRGRCAAAGMDDFIGKPVGPLELCGTLLRWLGRSVVQGR
jgi:CheY-like chemotaxis protein